ncbi:hypothetical protein [Adhaeretor mobilis]|uniref:hypothetical protein n=1 Tax=Adhaeretor mobilis TaxID=1930276 RepID=UPI0028F3E93B|nr:hypothetical protein [Adhaeretor mobilis]
MDGHDLSQTLTGDAPSPRTELLFYSSKGLLEGLRQGDWKILVKKSKAAKRKDANQGKVQPPQPKILLFDLTNDISETTNLADSNPEKVAALLARMTELDQEITANARTVWRKK